MHKKEPGCSWIEIKDIAQVFLVDDQNHPEREKICFMLANLFQVECINYLIISIEYIIIFRF